MGVLRQALRLHASFSVPLRPEDNASPWDRAYRALADASPAAHMERVGDVDWQNRVPCYPRGRCMTNSVYEALFNPGCCPGSNLTEGIVRQFDL